MESEKLKISSIGLPIDTFSNLEKAICLKMVKKQIEISKYYERLPKPVAIAMSEMLDDKIYIRKTGTEETEQ